MNVCVCVPRTEASEFVLSRPPSGRRRGVTKETLFHAWQMILRKFINLVPNCHCPIANRTVLRKQRATSRKDRLWGYVAALTTLLRQRSWKNCLELLLMLRCVLQVRFESARALSGRGNATMDWPNVCLGAIDEQVEVELKRKRMYDSVMDLLAFIFLTVAIDSSKKSRFRFLIVSRLRSFPTPNYFSMSTNSGASIIYVKTLTGKQLELNYETCKDFRGYDLKEHIFSLEGIPPQQQALLSGGRGLQDHAHLVDDYGIRPGSTLHLILRLGDPSSSCSGCFDTRRTVGALLHRGCADVEVKFRKAIASPDRHDDDASYYSPHFNFECDRICFSSGVCVWGSPRLSELPGALASLDPKYPLRLSVARLREVLPYTVEALRTLQIFDISACDDLYRDNLCEVVAGWRRDDEKEDPNCVLLFEGNAFRGGSSESFTMTDKYHVFEGIIEAERQWFFRPGRTYRVEWGKECSKAEWDEMEASESKMFSTPEPSYEANETHQKFVFRFAMMPVEEPDILEFRHDGFEFLMGLLLSDESVVQKVSLIDADGLSISCFRALLPPHLRELETGEDRRIVLSEASLLSIEQSTFCALLCGMDEEFPILLAQEYFVLFSELRMPIAASACLAKIKKHRSREDLLQLKKKANEEKIATAVDERIARLEGPLVFRDSSEESRRTKELIETYPTFLRIYWRRLVQLFNSRSLDCNVNLEAQIDGVVFPAHLEVLILESAYFRRLISFEGQETTRLRSGEAILLEGFDSNRLRILLSSFYCLLSLMDEGWSYGVALDLLDKSEAMLCRPLRELAMLWIVNTLEHRESFSSARELLQFWRKIQTEFAEEMSRCPFVQVLEREIEKIAKRI